MIPLQFLLHIVVVCIRVHCGAFPSLCIALFMLQTAAAAIPTVNVIPHVRERSSLYCNCAFSSTLFEATVHLIRTSFQR